MKTAQQWFNFVAKKLLAQGKKSIKNGECAYRGPNGLKCAIGHAIPDRLYSKEIEKKSAFGILNKHGGAYNKKISKYLTLSDKQRSSVDFWEDLQGIHDGYRAIEWRRKLAEFAERWRLNDKVLRVKQ